MAGSGPRSRIVVVGFITIFLILLVSMLSERFFLGAALVAIPMVLILLVGSPARVLAAVFALQVVFTMTQLSCLSLQVGILPVRIDDALLFLFLALWLLTLPDGSMRKISIGIQGYLVLAFLGVFCYSAYVGRASGNEMLNISYQLLPYGHYVMYFPLLAVLSDRRNFVLIWRTLLAAAVVGGIVYAVKGYTRTGEEVYIRETTGVRVATRQPNAIVAVMLMFLGRLWKDWRNRPPLLFVIPGLVFMGIALVLSQTRGIWGGFILAMASGWILNLFRKKDRVKMGKKLLVSVTVSAFLVVLIIFSVSVTGILTAGNIASRTSETSSFTTSESTLARLLAWSAILGNQHGKSLLLGRGLGATYTSYRPDIGSVMTVYYVDGSYFQLLLNMGLVGVVVFMSMFLVTLWKAAGLFVRTENRERAGIALGIFCAVIMLLFASGFASVLTNYRFTTLWAFLMAVIQVESSRDAEERKNILSERRGRLVRKTE